IWSQSSGKYITSAATTTATSSTIWIVRGVPPRIHPTLKSWSNSPATAAATHTTAATPSTAITPLAPETLSETMSSAATIRVERVTPETGLFDEPIIPTKYPDTVQKKKPATSITIAAVIPAFVPARLMYSAAIAMNTIPIRPKTVFDDM